MPNSNFWPFSPDSGYGEETAVVDIHAPLETENDDSHDGIDCEHGLCTCTTHLRTLSDALSADHLMANPNGVFTHLFPTESFDREMEPLIRLGFAKPAVDTADSVLWSFARTLGVWNTEVRDHGFRVARYADRLAAAVGLSTADRHTLRMGCVLHDVGKLAVPAEILNKPGRLNEREFALVKEHTWQGAFILETLRSIHSIVPFIRSHHERLDGKGYPDGLRGDQISLPIRIIAVADVYDALSSSRSYHQPLNWGDCLEIIKKNAFEGGLDAELVAEFCNLVERDCLCSV